MSQTVKLSERLNRSQYMGYQIANDMVHDAEMLETRVAELEAKLERANAVIEAAQAHHLKTQRLKDALKAFDNKLSETLKS